MGVVIRFPRRRGSRSAGADRPLFPGFGKRESAGDPGRTAATDARKHAFKSDATIDDLPRPGVAPNPDVERRRRRVRRSALTAGLVVFVLGLIVSLFAREGALDVRRQRRAYDALKAEVAIQQTRVQELKQRVDDLERDPAAIEAIAREQLNYAAPGEIVLLLPGLDEKPRSDMVPAAERTLTRGGAAR